MLHSALLDSSISDCGILHYCANYEFLVWLLSVHVRSLSVLTPPHCSLLSAPTAQAATELRELSCEHVLAAILAFHHLPNHSVGSDLTHAMRRYSMEPHLTFLEPCFNENRDQFVKTGSGQT
jgi:hypothetical protein|eukprot:COSAG06_NODE_1761_length_8450_cov_7621.426536_4_plen_122_part_00